LYTIAIFTTRYEQMLQNKKLTLFLSLFVLFFLIACDSPSLAGKKVEKTYFTGGQLQSELIWNDSTGKNGTLKKYGYEGHQVSTVPIVNGVKHGIETLFDKKGRVIRQIPYDRGRIHGMLKDFYPNGKVMASIPYTYGIKEGTASTYRQDGSVDRSVRFKNDKIVN